MPADAPHLALGIDIGGTFTDLIVYEQNGGTYKSHKQLTTPDDPTEGVIAGLRHLADREGLAFSSISRVVHATTLFTNALIERKGAATGLLTTAGFRDTLEIARERKYELYDIFIELPAPLVRRSLRLRGAASAGTSGAVETPLDRDALVRQARTLIERWRAVDRHRLPACLRQRRPRAAALARAGAALPRHLRVDLVRRRAADPRVRARLDHGRQRLHQAARQPLPRRAGRQSSRGSASAPPIPNAVERRPDRRRRGASAIRSRCSNRVRRREPWSARISAARSECRHVLAFDMGGTTAKLVRRRGWASRWWLQLRGRTREQRFIEGSGLPINISTIELIEIGAGGGSIAACRRAGAAEGGAAKRGAAPGPACYRRGGERPTVTDANLAARLSRRGGVRRRHHADRRTRRRWPRSSVWRVRSGWRDPDGVGHAQPRQRDHGERRARAHRRAGPRSAPLCAAGDRRRRSAARLRGRPQARHRAP